MIKISKKAIYDKLREFTHLSTTDLQFLNQDSVSFLYGCRDSLDASLSSALETYPAIYYVYQQYNATRFGDIVSDCINIIGNIVQGRVIYKSNSLVICYGQTLVTKKITPGELMIAVVDSKGLWSMDKDNQVHIDIATLRAAKAAVKNWRGNRLVGEITHHEAKRLAKFLELKPLKNSSLVVLDNISVSQGFKPRR